MNLWKTKFKMFQAFDFYSYVLGASRTAVQKKCGFKVN